MPTDNKAAEQVTAAEQLDAVLHWRSKHAQAIRERDTLQQRLNTADQTIDDLQGAVSRRSQRIGELVQQLAVESAIKEPTGEDVLWQVLDAAIGVLTRRAAPHAWESEAHQAGSKIILARRAGLAATVLKPAEGGGDKCVKEDS